MHCNYATFCNIWMECTAICIEILCGFSIKTWCLQELAKNVPNGVHFKHDKQPISYLSSVHCYLVFVDKLNIRNKRKVLIVN